MALSALTGNFDRKGGQLPGEHTFTHQIAGFTTLEDEFADGTEPKDAVLPVGAIRFPLWYHMEREMQCVDLPRQIHEGTPYPVKALFALGLNYRILPDDQYFKSAMEKLDFFVDADLFMTDAAKMADIVLPVCTSYERGELETYPGGYAWLTKPAIDRVGESKSDAEILCELAKVMNLGDKRLEEGYEKNIEEILSNLDLTMDELRSSDLPVKVRGVKPYVPGTILEKAARLQLVNLSYIQN